MTTESVEADLYQDLVIDHKRSPRNFGHLDAPTHRAQGTNPLCGDDIGVELRVEAGRIGDIRFVGQGCAICIASTSMMTESVLGQDVDAARRMHRQFRAVLTGEAEPSDAPLGKLLSLAGVRHYPSRIKCALLGWHALMHALADPDTADGSHRAAPDPGAR